MTAIATAALTAGNTTGVPAEIVANDTLFVKTGQFNECPPMVIPGCAVVGDELRSTKIPAASLTNLSDTQYPFAGITHMASIIDDIITNTSVTAQTGNAISQNTAEPVVQVRQELMRHHCN